MAGLRYNDDPYAGMPDYLRSAAKKNLASTDSSISAFNDRMRFFPMQNTAPQPTAVERSSFSFTLNGGNDKDQLSLNGIPSSVTANGVPQPQATPTSGDNWRLRGFDGSSNQPYDQVKSQGLLPNGLTSVSHAPGATVTSPDAYHQVISNYKPRDMTKERGLYGWGGDGIDQSNAPQYHYPETLETKVRQDPQHPVMSGFRKIQTGILPQELGA